MVKCFPPLVYGIHNGHLLHLKLWHANWSFPCTRAKHWVYISLRIIYPRYVIQIPLQDSLPPPFPHQHNRPLYEDMKSPSDPIPHNKHRNITPYFGAFSCFVIHANTYQPRKCTKKHEKHQKARILGWGGGRERQPQRKIIKHQKSRMVVLLGACWCFVIHANTHQPRKGTKKHKEARILGGGRERQTPGRTQRLGGWEEIRHAQKNTEVQGVWGRAIYRRLLRIYKDKMSPGGPPLPKMA